MSSFDAVTTLIGNGDSIVFDGKIERMSNKELILMAKETKNMHVLHHVLMNQMCLHCYHREYMLVNEYAEEYKRIVADAGTKRALDVVHPFYWGIGQYFLSSGILILNSKSDTNLLFIATKPKLL